MSDGIVSIPLGVRERQRSDVQLLPGKEWMTLM